MQGSPADIGGYYRPDAEKASAVMRPSKTFNDLLAALQLRRSQQHAAAPPGNPRGVSALEEG